MTEYAFPDPHLTHIKGMTLRDYFAAQALQARIARGDTRWDEVAQTAYAYADAMMKERAK